MTSNNDDDTINISLFLKEYVFDEKTSTFIFLFLLAYLSLDGLYIFVLLNESRSLVTVTYYVLAPLLIIYLVFVIYYYELKLRPAIHHFFLKIGIKEENLKRIMKRIYRKDPRLIDIKTNFTNALRTFLQGEKDSRRSTGKKAKVIVRTTFMSFILYSILFILIIGVVFEFSTGESNSVYKTIRIIHPLITLGILFYLVFLSMNILLKILNFTNVLNEEIGYQDIKKFVIHKDNLTNTISLCYWLFIIGALIVIFGIGSTLFIDILRNFSLQSLISDWLIQIVLFIAFIVFLFFPDHIYSKTIQRCKKKYIKTNITNKLSADNKLNIDLIIERNEIEKIPDSLLLINKIWITILFFLSYRNSNLSSRFTV